MSNKIKMILDKNLKDYQNLSIYEILNVQNLNEKFLKMGKILFLLNYLCSHKKILVSYALKFLSTIEEDIKKVGNFKLESFFAFENKLSFFQKILFESLSQQQNVIHPEVLKEEIPTREKENFEVGKKSDDLKNLISQLFSTKKTQENHDDHTTLDDLKKMEMEKEEIAIDKASNATTKQPQSFKRRKYAGKEDMIDFDNMTKKKKLNI